MERAVPRRRELLVATAVATAFVLLRLLWHPHFLLDDETTFVNTVGREWSLGAPGAWTRYQLISYQGSFLFDALLSSLGYRVVGDHLLAWFWVPMAYVTAFAALVATLSARIGGRWGLWLWVALLSGAPFLLKDGLISMPGGHTTSIVWVLLALVAVQRALDGSDRAALAAGVIAGFATWYTRSAVLVVAVVPLVFVLAGRWRSMRHALVGLLSLPLMVLINGWALTVAGPWAGQSPPEDVWSRMLWNVYELGSRDWSPVGKALEVVGLRGWRQLFAQPEPLPGEIVSSIPALPGALWAAALVGAVLIGGALLVRRARDRRGVEVIDAVGLLVLLYAAAYIGSPLRIEPETLDFAGAPFPTMVRYVTPAMLVGLVLIGLGAARLAAAGGRLRQLAVVLVVVLAVPGLIAALADRSDRAGSIWEARMPFKYYRVFGAHRGLSRELLAGWSSGDAASEENRLLVLGSFEACSPVCVDEDRLQPARRLAIAASELELDPGQRRVLAKGMGMAFADHLWSSDEIGGDRLLLLAIEAAELMSSADGAAWLDGFGTVAEEDPGLLRLDGDQLVGELCGLEMGGDRPLCRIAGGPLSFECGDEGVEELLRASVTEATLPDAVEAVGWRHGRDLPPWQREGCEASLGGELAQAYGRGWTEGGRRRWREPSTGDR